MSYRSRKEYRPYAEHTKQAQKKSDVCEFCLISAGSDQLVEESTYFKVIINLFPYSVWDYRRVLDHLMIVPKKHTDTLSSLTAQEAVEYLELISKYEPNGYDVFARAPSSTGKSVPHQHTHLIKAQGKPVKIVLHTKKPYLRFTR